MKIVQIKHLNKTYEGLTAVDDFSFAVAEGEIMSLVGPDGAGKTSLFRALCGLIDFQAEKAEVAGYDIKTGFDRIKPLLGYMPQAFSLYPDLSVEENLRFYAGLFGFGKSDFEREKGPLYEFSGLGPFKDRRAGNLSGGMKQKLALSCSLIHKPRLLVLDEPTTGVDPLSRRQFWDILKSLRENGSTIVVSTPYMDEVELSDRTVFMHRGRKLAEGTPKELAGKYEGRVYLVNIAPTTENVLNLRQIEGIDVRRFGASLHIYTEPALGREELHDKLEQHGVARDLTEEIPAELEDVFIQLMGK